MKPQKKRRFSASAPFVLHEANFTKRRSSSCTNSRNTIGDVGTSSCISLNLDQAGFEDDARLLNSPLYILPEISEFTRRLMRRPLQSSEVVRTTVYGCYVFLSKRISNLHVTSGKSSSVIRMVESTSLQVATVGRAQCSSGFLTRRENLRCDSISISKLKR